MGIELNILADTALNIIFENVSLKYALERLDVVSVKVLLVVDSKEKYVAALTDGDVRRAILAGASLETPISRIANYNPIYLEKEDLHQARIYLEQITAVPVVDADKQISRVYVRKAENRQDYSNPLNLPVVMMAGGLGTRLYPYTKVLPKPLIPVADIPISERIVQAFRKIGCKEFHMIVNYKKNMIKAYFNDLDCDYNICFWDEDIPLGTGGGLSLLNGIVHSTFIMTNCDILIWDDVRKIVEHHVEEKNKVTMVCSLKNFEIPYGVVNFTEGGEISSFDEKPKLSFFMNTGYYILETDVFKYVQQGEKIDMPDIIDRMKIKGEKIGIYPIGENAWLDMGQFDTMESMERRIKEINMDA